MQFKKGQPYNQKIFEDIDKKIQNIDFLQVNSPAEIEFHENTADLFLYLSQKKSNYLNGNSTDLQKPAENSKSSDKLTLSSFNMYKKWQNKSS